MNGAESLVATLVDQGVDICFANPGTSEMHFLAALGDNPGMRSSAATKCISEVPGLAKQTSTPLAARVDTRDSAPFVSSFMGLTR